MNLLTVLIKMMYGRPEGGPLWPFLTLPRAFSYQAPRLRGLVHLHRKIWFRRSHLPVALSETEPSPRHQHSIFHILESLFFFIPKSCDSLALRLLSSCQEPGPCEDGGRIEVF